jgi:hypothetical protein
MKRNSKVLKLIGGLIILGAIVDFASKPENLLLLKTPVGMGILLIVSLCIIFYARWFSKSFGAGKNNLVANMDAETLTIINGEKTDKILFSNIDILSTGMSSVLGTITGFHDAVTKKEFTINSKMPNYEEIKKTIIEKAQLLETTSSNNFFGQKTWAKENRMAYAKRQLLLKELIFYIPIAALIIYVVYYYIQLFRNP